MVEKDTLYHHVTDVNGYATVNPREIIKPAMKTLRAEAFCSSNGSLDIHTYIHCQVGIDFVSGVVLTIQMKQTKMSKIHVVCTYVVLKGMLFS
jgi:hypothetical protein